MSYIIVNKIKPLDTINGYWTNEDYLNLLEILDITDAELLDPTEYWDFLSMAINDVEPNKVAAILLDYKLGNILNNGQIQNIAHEMLEDKIAEEYPDISLHYDLYNINQLLYKAYNGKFPKTLATQIDLEFIRTGDSSIEVSKEMILRSIEPLLSDRNPIKRLFEAQFKDENTFKEANYILWELHNLGHHQYRIITSDYWINREDIIDYEFSS